METINGKVLVFTDIHFGLKSDSLKRLLICKNVMSEIKKYVIDNKIKHVIFMGDYFHSRSNLDIKTLETGYRCLKSLSEHTKVYFILGNHDIYMKSTSDIASANIFKDIKNVKIFSEAEDVMINGKKAIFIPWFSDLSKYKKNTFDMALGHFDICSDYLIASYIEANSHRLQASEKYTDLINNDELLRKSGLDDLDFSQKNIEETIVHQKKSSELIGDWVEIVKEKGLILSGHIHNRKEFFTKKRKFIFVGSPYQQTMGEIESDDGFYVMNEKNEISFEPLSKMPKHIEIKMSEVVNDIDNFDFSVVNNNIIHKIYDVEVDRVLDSKITQRIVDNKPYEELNPDYIIKNKNENSLVDSDESINMIRKSKIDYLRNYINNIDNRVMEKEGLNKDELIKTMSEYYERVNY